MAAAWRPVMTMRPVMTGRPVTSVACDYKAACDDLATVMFGLRCVSCLCAMGYRLQALRIVLDWLCDGMALQNVVPFDDGAPADVQALRDAIDDYQLRFWLRGFYWCRSRRCTSREFGDYSVTAPSFPELTDEEVYALLE